MPAVARTASAPRSAAEIRADALVAQLADDELDQLAMALARLLLSAAARRAEQPERRPTTKHRG